MDWILLCLFYGLAKGGRELLKKQALKKSPVIEVLFFYTLFSLVLVSYKIFSLEPVEAKWMAFIALKSFIIFLAWICGFKALDNMPVSIYGILDLARVLFSMALGVLVLKETMSKFEIIGMLLVITGLLMLKWNPKKTKESASDNESDSTVVIAEPSVVSQSLYVLLAMASCFLNAVSGTMDKIVTKHVESGTLQFWYMLFIAIFYAIYILVTKSKISIKNVVKNPWIFYLSILFVLADRALFLANAIPDSKVTVMTLIKQSGCVVVILGGRIFFKEKRTAYKLLCAAVIVSGIVMAALLG